MSYPAVIEQKSIVFYEDEITAVVVDVDGEPSVYVPLLPICEYLGLDWSAQNRRVRRDEILNDESVILMLAAADGRTREMMCLPLDLLNGSLSRVYRNMRRTEMFLKAYANLYSNAGATTKGADPRTGDTIQGMSLQRIETIIQKLTDGTYRWQPARRVYVPKSNGEERPISIPGWTDKMVQEVMRLILEAYYEPRFRDSSHGFRPNRGCHTALKPGLLVH
jgi:hypothetical protein